MEINEAKNTWDSITHFCCDRCKAIRPVKGKPNVLETKGPFVLCEGDFVCEPCGFHLSTYCENCKKVQPVDIEDPWMNAPEDGSLGGDVLCSTCRTIPEPMTENATVRNGIA